MYKTCVDVGAGDQGIMDGYTSDVLDACLQGVALSSWVANHLGGYTIMGGYRSVKDDPKYKIACETR